MANYRLTYSATAIRGFDKIPRKIADAILAFCEGPLLENPHRVGKPLRAPFDGEYTAKRGSYRIIYFIVEDQVMVQVVRLEHRSTVYRSR
jgi:mRNA-degrading endonuclease RelE of RelBE toxin-antitoxin system